MDQPTALDINAASVDAIGAVAALQGHGFKTVRYREERSRFDALRQLEKVPGLAGKVDELDDMIRFG